MTITKRILMLMATSCLVVLLAASFAMAELKATDLPPDEILIEAGTVLFKHFKGAVVLGKYKPADHVNYHHIFFKLKKGFIPLKPFTLIRLDTGIWTLGIEGVDWAEIHKTEEGFVVIKK